MNDTQALAPPLGAIETADSIGVQATAVQTAMELDLFSLIAAGHERLETIAATAGCNPRGMRVLLDALCALGLLVKAQGRYTLSPTAEAYLVRGSPGYCVPIYLAWFQNRERFRHFVRTGQAGLDLTASEAGALWASYAAPTRLQWPEIVGTMRGHWAAAGVTPADFPGPRILDVGCGAGDKSFCLLQDDPEAHVTGLDRPEVLVVAADVARAMGVSERVRLTASPLGDSCASARFDIVLFCRLLYYFDDAAAIRLIQQALGALTGRGMVVVWGSVLDEERSQSPALLSAIDVCNGSPWTTQRTASEYCELLRQAGCVEVSQPSPHMIIGRGPGESIPA
jgi:2-polyprenyl-3-methyl-5-hydroxy-6-metoxy-1,4-benzoquinol methylase